MTLNKKLSVSACHLSFFFFKEGPIRIQNLSQKQERWVLPGYKLHEVKNHICFILPLDPRPSSVGAPQTFVHLIEMTSYLLKDSLASSVPFPPFLTQSWDKDSRRLSRNWYRVYSPSSHPRATPSWDWLPHSSIEGPGWQPTTLPPFAFQGMVLLEKTLIPSCHDSKRQWLTAGVGEWREATGSAQFRIECLLGPGSRGAYTSLPAPPPKKGFFPEGPLPDFKKNLSTPIILPGLRWSPELR